MTRLAFGVILGLLIAYPALLAILLSIASMVLMQPVVLTFAAGVILRPRFARTVRGWAR